MGVSETAPAVLTVEQLEELAKLTAASVRLNGHVDLCYCNGCKRANAASEKLVEKLDPALPALLEMARAYHRLTSALEFLRRKQLTLASKHQSAERIIKRAQDFGFGRTEPSPEAAATIARLVKEQ